MLKLANKITLGAGCLDSSRAVLAHPIRALWRALNAQHFFKLVIHSPADKHQASRCKLFSFEDVFCR